MPPIRDLHGSRVALVKPNATELAEPRDEFALHRNPYDPKDEQFLALIAAEKTDRVEELTQRVATA
jgi:hypothetical protein